MILTAADVGVDSCWVNIIDPEQLAEALGLTENEEVCKSANLFLKSSYLFVSVK